MLVFSPIDQQLYEEVAEEMTYYKMFKFIIEDFVSRKDAGQMMRQDNLPVNTSVETVVNTAVQVAVPAGTGTGVGAGNGSGAGTVKPIYSAQSPNAESRLLAEKYKILLAAGGAKAAATIGG